MKTYNSGMKIHTGISSIIMLLVTLCLTTFGLLSYSTAKADLNLTKKTAEHTYNYYNADLESEKNISKINSEILSSLQQNNTLESNLLNLQKEIEGLNYEFLDDGSFTVKFITPVDETQNLETIINFNLLDSSKNNIKITKHILSTQEFQEIQDIDVWEG